MKEIKTTSKEAVLLSLFFFPPKAYLWLMVLSLREPDILFNCIYKNTIRKRNVPKHDFIRASSFCLCPKQEPRKPKVNIDFENMFI